MIIRERLALRNKVKEGERLEIYGGLRQEVEIKRICTAQ